MKFKNIATTFFLILISSMGILAQNEAEILPEGIVFPRLTTADRNALTAIQGQCIYNTTTLSINCYDGTNWVDTAGGGNGGAIQSKIEDADGDTYVGTEDLSDQDIINFVTAGNKGWRINENRLEPYPFNMESIHIGHDAGMNSLDKDNTFIGSYAGKNNIIGLDNTFIGHSAGELNTVSNNTFIGKNAGKVSNGGFYNTFVGKDAGFANNNGGVNVFMGASAGRQNTEGNYNTFIGAGAGSDNILGSNNVHIGNEAGGTSDQSERLYIANSNTDEPLIYGEFDNDKLVVYGKVGIGGTTALTHDLYVNDRDNSGEASILIKSGSAWLRHVAYANQQSLIGTFSNHDLGLVTGEIARIKIFASGGNTSVYKNLGIGTNASVTEELEIHDHDNDGDVIARLESSDADIQLGYNAIKKGHIGTTTADDFSLLSNNTTRLRVFSSGDVSVFNNLGVGVQTGLNDEITIADNDGDGDVITRMEAGAGEMVVGYNSSSEGLIGMISNHKLGFRTNNSTRMTILKTGEVGIGTSTPTTKLSVIGSICYTGSSSSCSDLRYKKDVVNIPEALDKLSQLNGVYYNWETEKYTDKEFSEDRQIGVIAQEVETLFPELVMTDADGYKSVDYSKLTPILIEAIKDLKKQLEQQQTSTSERIAKLESFVSAQASNH